MHSRSGRHFFSKIKRLLSTARAKNNRYIIKNIILKNYISVNGCLGNSKLASAENLNDINEKLKLLLGNLHELKIYGIGIRHGCLDANVNVFLMEILYGRENYLVNALCDAGIDVVSEEESYGLGNVYGVAHKSLLFCFLCLFCFLFCGFLFF